MCLTVLRAASSAHKWVFVRLLARVRATFNLSGCFMQRTSVNVIESLGAVFAWVQMDLCKSTARLVHSQAHLCSARTCCSVSDVSGLRRSQREVENTRALWRLSRWATEHRTTTHSNPHSWIGSERVPGGRTCTYRQARWATRRADMTPQPRSGRPAVFCLAGCSAVSGARV